MGGNRLVPTELPVRTSENNNQKVYFLGVSSDEQWIAYSDTGLYGDGDLLSSKPMLGLISQEGDRQEQVIDLSLFQPYIETYYASQINGWRLSSTRWVGNQLIPMSIGLRSDLSTGSHLKLVYGLLDPFQAGWDTEKYSQLPGWQPDYYVAFSPDMTRALYAAKDLDQVILWDFGDQRVLWQKPLQNMIAPGGLVYQWSYDGSKAAFEVSQQDGITSILKDGFEVTLPDIFENDFGRDQLLFDFRLSPDGNSVALLYHLFNPYEKMVFIYNFQIQEFTLRCSLLPGNQPFWSPDSRFLTSGQWNLELSETPTPLLVLNVESGFVYQLTNDGSVLEWLQNDLWRGD